MNSFYNKNGVGDVLLVQLTTDKSASIISKTTGDVTVISDEVSKKAVAFNLFNASSYFQLDSIGTVELTKEFVAKLQEVLKSNGVDLELAVDFSPKFVVGLVLKKEKHPNADKLNVCQVDVGGTTLQIVCGAPNVDENQKVVVAKVGAVMPSGMIIKDAELRGVASTGMICSAKELDLPNAPEEKGILVLEESSIVGEAFSN